MKCRTKKKNLCFSVWNSNYLPTHTLGVKAVSQKVKVESVVQSLWTWHSSGGAKEQIRDVFFNTIVLLRNHLRYYPQKFPHVSLSSETPLGIIIINPLRYPPKHSNSLPNSYQEIYSLFFSKKHRLHIPAQNIHPPLGSSINVIASILKLFDPPSSPLGATSSWC